MSGFDFTDLDHVADAFGIFGGEVAEIMRTAGRRAVLGIMVCAIPAQSGAADEAEFYGYGPQCGARCGRRECTKPFGHDGHWHDDGGVCRACCYACIDQCDCRCGCPASWPKR